MYTKTARSPHPRKGHVSGRCAYYAAAGYAPLYMFRETGLLHAPRKREYGSGCLYPQPQLLAVAGHMSLFRCYLQYIVHICSSLYIRVYTFILSVRHSDKSINYSATNRQVTTCDNSTSEAKLCCKVTLAWGDCPQTFRGRGTGAGPVYYGALLHATPRLCLRVNSLSV